jgi:hypothetical protein
MAKLLGLGTMEISNLSTRTVSGAAWDSGGKRGKAHSNLVYFTPLFRLRSGLNRIGTSAKPD